MLKIVEYKKHSVKKLQRLESLVNSLRNDKFNGFCIGHMYAPYYKNGSCRFCWKYNKTDKDILIKALESV